MTRYVLLAALGLAVAVGSASADCGKTGCDKAGCDGGCEKYGWHPLLKIKNWFAKKKPNNCGGPRAGYGNFSPPPGIGYPGTPGADMPGTLVFPNHPYARSPRDFFMYEPK